MAFASVTHPQSNGQAEAANKQILNGLKKKLEDCKGGWVDMLPEVLWANRTTEKEATGETPFRLTFGNEAVLPVEVGLASYRVDTFNPERNDQLMKESLDFFEEIRTKASLRSVAYKARICRAYNKRVQPREMGKGDLVLRKTSATGKAGIDGKLTANWEGPYRITEQVVPGSYRLMDMAGKKLKNTWNAGVLKKYYV